MLNMLNKDFFHSRIFDDVARVAYMYRWQQASNMQSINREAFICIMSPRCRCDQFTTIDRSGQRAHFAGDRRKARKNVFLHACACVRACFGWRVAFNVAINVLFTTIYLAGVCVCVSVRAHACACQSRRQSQNAVARSHTSSYIIAIRRRQIIQAEMKLRNMLQAMRTFLVYRRHPTAPAAVLRRRRSAATRDRSTMRSLRGWLTGWCWGSAAGGDDDVDDAETAWLQQMVSGV